jgi:hypothetical protein
MRGLLIPFFAAFSPITGWTAKTEGPTCIHHGEILVVTRYASSAISFISENHGNKHLLVAFVSSRLQVFNRSSCAFLLIAL